ncbi:MAG: nuclear transport factor 2 family protein [Kofleriaceae bacterium]|nr:nuclear transport factor 2 family protein [Kofleriaceae bacterium]
MNLLETVRRQVELLNAGRPLDAFDLCFADDGIMYDNDEVFAVGKQACRAKQEPFILAAQSIEGNITRCTLDIATGVSVLRNQTSFVGADGRSTAIGGIHVQRWENGKIVEERYYRDAMAEEKCSTDIFCGEEI